MDVRDLYPVRNTRLPRWVAPAERVGRSWWSSLVPTLMRVAVGISIGLEGIGTTVVSDTVVDVSMEVDVVLEDVVVLEVVVCAPDPACRVDVGGTADQASARFFVVLPTPGE